MTHQPEEAETEGVIQVLPQRPTSGTSVSKEAKSQSQPAPRLGISQDRAVVNRELLALNAKLKIVTMSHA